MGDDLVLAADHWPTNGHLIADVARLYLDRDMLTLDPTYGKGVWWSVWKPRRLIKRQWPDLHPEFDFRNMVEFGDDTFDLVAFDPPYVSTGGRETSTIGPFNERYGIGEHDETRSPRTLHDNVIAPGIDECLRVLKPGGYLLVKVKDYISSGKLWRGVTMVEAAVVATPLHTATLVDEFIMVGKPGAQSQTTQVHARQNCSHLLVFRKPR